MVRFEFSLPDADLDRVFAIKQLQGKDELTGNEFAAELLHSTLESLFPAAPQFDESGALVNGSAYRGNNF